jgi:hypothetical protein
MFSTIMFNGCKKDKLEFNNVVAKQTTVIAQGNSDVNIDDVNTSSWIPNYDQKACTTPSGEPGKLCRQGGGGTCSNEYPCTSILSLYPGWTKEEALEYWNKLHILDKE